jgi:hypothetical protein
MSTFAERLQNEEYELSERIEKLEAFIVGDKFDSLSEIDRKDLREQLKHMKAYHQILLCRCSRLCK